MARATVEARVSSLETKYENIMNKIDMFIGEMRDRDNQRAAEIREMRDRDNQRAAEIREMQARFDDKFNSHISQMHNMAIATMIGIGAMVVTVIYSVANR